MITGVNFAAGRAIYFTGGTSVPVSAVIHSDTVDPATGTVTLVTEVPLSARSGPVTVTSGGQNASAGNFTKD